MSGDGKVNLLAGFLFPNGGVVVGGVAAKKRGFSPFFGDGPQTASVYPFTSPQIRVRLT
jgi:hypothetical protein